MNICKVFYTKTIKAALGIQFKYIFIVLTKLHIFHIAIVNTTSLLIVLDAGESTTHIRMYP